MNWFGLWFWKPIATFLGELALGASLILIFGLLYGVFLLKEYLSNKFKKGSK